jgi:hypothetical protein
MQERVQEGKNGNQLRDFCGKEREAGGLIDEAGILRNPTLTYIIPEKGRMALAGHVRRQANILAMLK